MPLTVLGAGDRMEEKRDIIPVIKVFIFYKGTVATCRLGKDLG